MNAPQLCRCLSYCLLILSSALLFGCSALLPSSAQAPSFHSLDIETAILASEKSETSERKVSAATLLISPPYAAPGFDSRHIMYTRTAHKLEYFARHEWIDTPARMLAPMIAATLRNSGRFRAVALMPSAAAGDISLDTSILRLQQEFGPPDQASQVRFTLIAELVDNTTHRIIAAREFDVSVASQSADPLAGVLAANQSVTLVLNQLTLFAAESLRDWTAADLRER